METAGIKETQEVQEKVADSTGSEAHSVQQKGDGEAGTPAKAVTREREAGWGDYFR